MQLVKYSQRVSLSNHLSKRLFRAFVPLCSHHCMLQLLSLYAATPTENHHLVLTLLLLSDAQCHSTGKHQV